MGRRTNLRPKSINLPGLGIEDIDVEEIIGRPSTISRTPSNKARPKPKPPVNLEDALISKRPPILESIPGAGGIETINIPGVGQVRIPSVPAAPKATDIFPRELPEMGGGRGGINPELGKRADGSTIRLMDPDAMDYLKSQEITETSTSEETPTTPTPTGSYESSYIDWMESKPPKPTVRRLGRMPGGGPAYKRAQKKYREDLASWKASKPTRDSFTAPTPTPSPVETLPVETPLPVEDKPKPPTSPPVNPFEGFVPRNIIGASFDPKDVSAQQQMVADARARQTPGANIQGGGYLTYDNPILGNKQTQFGGYGQPMPTAPLMNYAGLSSPITYSTSNLDPDAQPGGPPPPKPPFF